MLHNIYYTEGMKISLVKGNAKLGKGVYTINLMPGEHLIDVKDKGIITNVKGTCEGCCDGCEKFCYAYRQTRQYHNTVIPSVGKNTVIMRHSLDDFFSQLKDFLIQENAHVLRYHSSGEIESYEYLIKMVQLAKELPEIKFYFYTKRFNFLDRYLKEYQKFPDNLICNVSEWNGNTKGYDLHGLNKFIYDDGSDPNLKNLHHCPAVDKNGHRTGINCDQCKKCFSKNDGHITVVYSH